MTKEPLLFHATCVSLDGRGIVLFGESGSGKSDLALRLIADGAVLVADDYIHLTEENGTLFAACPPTIKGMIEARGLGILKMNNIDKCPISLFVNLNKGKLIERLPLEWEKLPVETSLNIPCIRLNSFESATAAKIRLAIKTDFFLEKTTGYGTKEKKEKK